MKKQIITLTIVSAVLFLTGCGANINIASTQMQENTAPASTVPVSEVSAATEAVPAETTAAVTAAAAVTTAATAATSAAQTTVTTADSAQQDIKQFAGEWIFGENGGLCGPVTIKEDGTYTWNPYWGQELQTGKIEIIYEEHPNAKIPIYRFKNDDDSFWFGIYAPHTWNVNALYTGQDGASKLIRNKKVVTADGLQITYSDSTMQEAYRITNTEEEGYCVYECTVPFFECANASAEMKANIDELNEELRQFMIAQIREYEALQYSAVDFDQTKLFVRENPIGSEQINISYVPDFQDNNIFTLCLNTDWYGGGAHGGHSLTTFTVDLSQMKLIRSLDDISASTNEFVNFAADYFMEHYSEKYAGKNDWNTEYLRKALKEEQIWTFENYQFNVIFPEYSFGACYAEGPQELHIPLELCIPHMNAYGKGLFPDMTE